jgi:hypothetical protein
MGYAQVHGRGEGKPDQHKDQAAQFEEPIAFVDVARQITQHCRAADIHDRDNDGCQQAPEKSELVALRE